MGVCPSTRQKTWLAGAWGLVCLQALLSVALPHSPLLTALGDLIQSILLGAAALIILFNMSGVEGRARLFWFLLALGCGLWFAAQACWTYLEVFTRQEVPSPSLGDVVLFLHLVPMMGALAVKPHLEQNDRGVRLGGLDFALLLTWWLYLYLFLVIPWHYVLPDATLYGRNFDISYFLEHLAFVLAAALTWRHSTGPWRRIYGYLLGASLLYAASSVAASVAIDFGHYYTGSFYDIPLVAAAASFVTLGTLARRQNLRPELLKEPDERRGAWASHLAVFAILSLPVLAGWAISTSGVPMQVRSFRLLLTLGAMMVMGGLASLKQYRLAQELARANRELREASLTDLLTGAKNRRFLANTIETDVRQVIRSYTSQPHAEGKRNRDLIFYLIDLDHFKEVNDRYGHDVGDRVLVEVTRRLGTAIRYSDALIRWGGEEFLVLSRYTNRDEAARLAARVLTAIGGEPFELADGESMVRTCSIGWAAFPWFVRNPEAVDYEEVLHLADFALYQAKKMGRNQAIGMLPALDQPMPQTQGSSPVDKHTAGSLPAVTITTTGPSGRLEDSSGERGAQAAAAAAANIELAKGGVSC